MSGELFGRSQELDALDAFRTTSLAADRPAEWMAVVGMGGVGKTALVTAWLALLQQHHPEVRTQLIELADARTTAQLRELMASALSIPYSTEAQFLEALRLMCSPDRAMVLVLDNLEQLPSYASFARQLAAIEGLTTVVTTRVPLGDGQECPLQLDGLIEDRAAAAQAMFTAKALPLCPDVADHPECIEQACDLLAGHPLAIELFTAWLRTIPLNIAVDSLAESDELVVRSPQQSLESMESLLDRSWTLLGTNDAQVFCKLALFHGPFSYEDAIATTGTSLPVLSELITSSLLTRRDSDLFLHPLVRSYALAKLGDSDPGAVDAAQRAYVEYFRDRMFAAAEALRGPKAGQESSALAAAFNNVQGAWQLALDRGDWQAIGDMADGVAIYLKSQSRLFLSSELFSQALDRLSDAASLPSADESAAKALVAVGWRYAMTRLVQGDRAGALETVERCTLLCGRSDRMGRMGLSYMRGQIAIFAGTYPEAAEHLVRARSLADDVSQEWFLAEIDTASAMVAMALDQLDEARRLTRSVLATGRRLGNPVTISDAYYCLGTLDLDEDPAAALVLLNQAREIAEAASLTQKSRKYAAVIGRCHISLGDPETAIQVFDQALRETMDGVAIREPWVRIANQTGLAMALSLTGDEQHATALFTTAVRGLLELDDWPLMLETVLDICRLRASQSASPAWRSLLQVVATHEATMWEWQAEANALLETASNCSQPPDQDAASPHGVSLGVVAERALLVLQS